MTILHLRSTFHAGGTENLLVRLFNTPSERFRLILVLMKPGKMMHDLQEGQNRVVHLYRKRKFDPVFLTRLLLLVRREKPEAIHSHQEIELLYALLVRLFFPSIKMFHQIHLHNPADSVWFRVERWICNHFTTHTITVSDTLRNYVISHGFSEKKTVVMFNIVAMTQTHSSQDIHNFKAQIGSKKDDFIVGMIGNFVEDKDQLTLSVAFRQLLDSGMKIRLVLIGKEGPTYEACRNVFTSKEIGETVFFTGQLANASELISCFSLMVFSSKRETFGMAAIESLLYEVPVIASDIPVMKELSRDGYYFDLFSRGNASELATMISRYLGRKPDPARLAEARQYALENFTPLKYIEKLAGIYGC